MLSPQCESSPPVERRQSALALDALPVLRRNVPCTIGWLSTGGKANLIDLPYNLCFGGQIDTVD
jgi:hypothetical protein